MRFTRSQPFGGGTFIMLKMKVIYLKFLWWGFLTELSKYVFNRVKKHILPNKFKVSWTKYATMIPYSFNVKFLVGNWCSEIHEPNHIENCATIQSSSQGGVVGGVESSTTLCHVAKHVANLYNFYNIWRLLFGDF